MIVTIMTIITLKYLKFFNSSLILTAHLVPWK